MKRLPCNITLREDTIRLLKRCGNRSRYLDRLVRMLYDEILESVRILRARGWTTSDLQSLLEWVDSLERKMDIAALRRHVAKRYSAEPIACVWMLAVQKYLGNESTSYVVIITAMGDGG